MRLELHAIHDVQDSFGAPELGVNRAAGWDCALTMGDDISERQWRYLNTSYSLRQMSVNRIRCCNRG
jgi:hypothetical protein